MRKSLKESDLLLLDAKGTRMHRIARLAKPPLTWRRAEVGYLGQTRFFKNQRSCLDTYSFLDGGYTSNFGLHMKILLLISTEVICKLPRR